VTLAPDSDTRPRPRSAVSTGVGLVGLAGMLAWIAIARAAPEIAAALGIDWGGRGPMDGPWSALANVAACGIPMVLWSVLVDKVHRNPTTGIDWSAPKPLAATLDVSLVKLAGLWATWGAIAAAYALGRWYWQGNYLFAMKLFEAIAPALFVASIPYALWLDRYLVEPRDGAWHLGQWLVGQPGWDRDEIAHHLRAWAVKGFFLAFMVSIVPGGFAVVINTPLDPLLHDPVALAQWLITLTFVVDVGFATVGYALTLKPLDAHIRSANPYLAAWVAALICYPPFVLMNNGGVLDYHPGTAEWTHWMQGQPALLALTGAILLALTAVYAWATVAFGLRFSNLTHRGILTHGPYAWTKHPAYLSKNAFWWLSSLPFLATTGSLADAARNTAILAMVSAIYYWRAKTEEKHLGADPDYRAYAAWMERHGPITRRIEKLIGRTPQAAVPAE
jgi:protein-S-isoprenylcysteine O-methyltransferase Ste14